MKKFNWSRTKRTMTCKLIDFVLNKLLKSASKRGMFWMIQVYNKNMDYVGDTYTALMLADRGIVPELGHPESKTCSIGFSVKEQKWYGWSHRAIYGFSIGDTVEEGDCCASSGWTEEYLKENPDKDKRLPVGFQAKNLEDCKKMAMAFADSVS